MDLSTGKWFSGLFANAAYLDTWVKQNGCNITSRTASFSSASLDIQGVLKTLPGLTSQPVIISSQVPQEEEKVSAVPKKRRYNKVRLLDGETPKKRIPKPKPQEIPEDDDGTTTEQEEEQEIPKKRRVKKAPKEKEDPTSPLALEKEWWFKEVSMLNIIPQQLQPMTLPKSEVKFDNKRIVCFKNMYYLKKMFDGSAVGNMCMVRRALKRPKNTIPPFLVRRGGCSTEKECCQQAAKAFSHIWFHALLQTSNADESEKLILWNDLLETNITKKDELVVLVHILFDNIANGNQKLASFLRLSLKRAQS